MIVKEFSDKTCLYDGDDNLLYRIVGGDYRILGERKIEVYSGEVYVHNGARCTVRNESVAYIYDYSSATFYNESKGTISSGDNIMVCDNANVTVYDCNNLCVVDNAKANVYGTPIIKTRDKATVFVYFGNAEIEAWETSTVYAYASNTVYAYDKTKVYTFNRATVFAHHASTVYASGFGKVYNKGAVTKIEKRNFFGEVVKQVFTVKQDMLVYKKLQNNLIATLKLVKGQKFIAAKYEKCRTDRAFVVDISDNAETGTSLHDPTFVYRVGEEVRADCDSALQECATGIHFFLTREEAERW